MQDKIIIIDYGMGNLRSVEKKMVNLGANAIISSSSDEIMDAKKLVLPGVGHFANGIKNLKKYGLWDVLNKTVLESKTPILGICLGMQIMSKRSDEGNTEGLGWFDAEIVKFRVRDRLKYKVPHMGWNNVVLKKNSILFQGITEFRKFYFVHSYHLKCNDKHDILTTTKYEYSFPSAIQKGNIYGTQFHPEKSHDWGDIILKNFITI
jgi:glutamine amidotransferase